jgi:hypothetical protein
MPDNAFLMKNKHAMGCFKKGKFLVTKFIREGFKFAAKGFN